MRGKQEEGKDRDELKAAMWGPKLHPESAGCTRICCEKGSDEVRAGTMLRVRRLQNQAVHISYALPHMGLHARRCLWLRWKVPACCCLMMVAVSRFQQRQLTCHLSMHRDDKKRAAEESDDEPRKKKKSKR
jgi:hypothetical protein